MEPFIGFSSDDSSFIIHHLPTKTNENQEQQHNKNNHNHSPALHFALLEETLYRKLALDHRSTAIWEPVNQNNLHSLRYLPLLALEARRKARYQVLLSKIPMLHHPLTHHPQHQTPKQQQEEDVQ